MGRTAGTLRPTRSPEIGRRTSPPPGPPVSPFDTTGGVIRTGAGLSIGWPWSKTLGCEKFLFIVDATSGLEVTCDSEIIGFVRHFLYPLLTWRGLSEEDAPDCYQHDDPEENEPECDGPDLDGPADLMGTFRALPCPVGNRPSALGAFDHGHRAICNLLP